MAVEIKETGESAVENAVMGADLVTGAAVTVAENVTRALNHPVREAHKIERRGAAANKQLGKDVAGFMDDTVEAIDAIMPEKVALLGVRAIKNRARRKDLIGDVAYRTLELVNGGLEAVVGTLSRLERATQPPTRPGTTHTRPARPVRKAARSARRTVSRTASSARATARRGSASARRNEKKRS
jgi:argininosuccinate lyase